MWRRLHDSRMHVERTRHRDADSARRAEPALARGVEEMKKLGRDIFGYVGPVTRSMRRAAFHQQNFAVGRYGSAPDIGATHIQPGRPRALHFPEVPGNFINARYSRFPAAPSIGDSS